jgi:uncharacterized SAM-binding protein YcdF (DUF218 family)
MSSPSGDEVAVEAAPIGIDGLAMLALSCVVMLVSLGSTLLVALGYVVWIGVATAATAPAASVIIVLGMQLGLGGVPRKRYRRRLQRARRLLVPGAEIVILGGQTRAGVVSEAEAGMRYLLRSGVPAGQIRLEDRSRHTLENLRHYREQFGERPAEPPVLVTNRFHLARSSLMARGLGLAHTRCAAEDSGWALLRQVLGIVREAVLVHWYLVGRTYARWAGNERMTARIS